MDSKEYLKIKSLEKIKEYALSHKDDAIPYGEPFLMQASMWVKGFNDWLAANGYEIVKKDET